MDENEQIKSNMINGSLNIISGILLGMPISLQNNKNTTNSNDNLHKYIDQKKIISCRCVRTHNLLVMWQEIYCCDITTTQKMI